MSCKAFHFDIFEGLRKFEKTIEICIDAALTLSAKLRIECSNTIAQCQLLRLADISQLVRGILSAILIRKF